MQVVIAVVVTIGIIWFFAWAANLILEPEDTEFYHRQMMEKEAQDASAESEEE